MKTFPALAAFLAISIGGVDKTLAQSPSETYDATVAQVAFATPTTASRYSVFVSDLHLGIGRNDAGIWHATEDFRWPNALLGFLDEISRRGDGKTDLIIVGDFLEMWQPPEHIRCAGVSADLGCTLAEMAAIAELIVDQHTLPLNYLRDFAERHDNRIYIIPGNHDSTIRYERVWRPLGKKLNAASGRINLVTSGIWGSTDGRIVAEHGHQIGSDVNAYATWPRIVRSVNQVDYVIRPWGELFVQKLFNDQEETYPIIDNLSPESAGARFRAADRGLWRSASDVARFVLFNLLETSPKQQLDVLGNEEAGKNKWDVQAARKSGANLFLNALSPRDPFRAELEKSDNVANAVRDELNNLASNAERIPDEEVLHLCDLAAKNGASNTCGGSDLGAAAQALFVAKSKIIARHLAGRQRQFKAVQLFVYGHTHQYEMPWSTEIEAGTVTVVNTGAFQRLVSEEGFKKRLGGMTPQEGLRKIALEQLAPCYIAVIVPPSPPGSLLKPEVYAWHMPEDGSGEFISPTHSRCE